MSLRSLLAPSWRGLLLALMLVSTAFSSAQASVPPNPSRSFPELQSLFPRFSQLPEGLVLVEEGGRNASEIAATFPDPDDAAAIMRTTDWAFNAYQAYESSDANGLQALSRLEISFHQFSSDTGAAFAMPFFIHARARVLDRTEVPPWEMGNTCDGAVTTEYEVTRYRRIGDLLVRVTAAASPELSPGDGYYVALEAASRTMDAVTSSAGSSRQFLESSCR
ncbi:MAG: hypothetical protein M3Z20_18240 [Chloroflexota bacterium]|nr:hypothetical protein [Chloroflexota bacterium]